MASADRPILVAGTSPAPLSYTVANAQEILLLAAHAVVDGTAALTSFRPTVEIVAPGGQIVASCPTSTTVSAGGTAEVSWFPGVGGFGTQNVQTFVGARIYRNSAQSIANGTPTDIHYTTVQSDTNGMANLAANDRILTVQTAGFYVVQLGITYNANATGRRIGQLYTNGYYSIPSGTQLGAWSQQALTEAGATTTVAVTTLSYFNVGDFISSGTFQSSGGALSTVVTTANYLAAALIGVS